MNEHLEMSREEWELVVELLENEHDDLPVEIHHCRVNAYRDELRRKQLLVQGLWDRMQAKVGA